jgi:ribonuclease HII
MRNAAKLDSSRKNESDSRVSLFPGMEILEIGLVFEDQARESGFRSIAGIDEVGRGCLAGPVVAAACILDHTKPVPDGIDDSKKLTRQQREEIAEQLKADCVAYAVGQIEADEIDRINILEATKKAMLAAIDGLSQPADFLLIDALQLKHSPLPQKAIIKGDAISVSIAAASILAKTYRDKLMTDLDAVYPEYGFAGHKGYGAQVHLEALRVHGPCPLHRRSFRGVLPDIEPDLQILAAR